MRGMNRVLLIGTSATVNSDSYRLLIHRRRPDISVRSVACPLFVPLVEEGLVTGTVPEQIAKSYLDASMAPPPDGIILGCTHYPLLTNLIRKVIPKSVKIIDSALACARATEDFLAEHGMMASETTGGPEQFFVTDMPASFFGHATRFLGRPPTQVDKVLLGRDL